MSEPKSKVKSFEIPKRLIYQAWEKVRANAGAPGWTRSASTSSSATRGTTSTSSGTG
jgi:hypothetical protein